jgi:hypothetical protein
MPPAGQDGTLSTAELQTIRLQHWSSREFEDLLAEAGFSSTLVTAGYQDAAKPGTANRTWTFQATAPHAPWVGRDGGGARVGRTDPVAGRIARVAFTRGPLGF